MSKDSALSSQARIDVLTLAWQIGSSRRVLAATLAALSILALLSIVIPQMPGEIAADPASATRWLAANTQEQGVIWRIIGPLGLFQIYNSVIWRSLCGLLFICLSVHLADELPARQRLWQRGLDAAISVTRPAEIRDTLTLTTEAAEALQQEMLARAGTTQTPKDNGSLMVTARHGQVGIWAKPTAQIGGILLLLGLWISGQTAWHESGLFLSPDRDARLAHRPDLTLQWVASQPPRVKLRGPKGESELSIGRLRPAYREGIGFFLTGQTPAVTIRGTGSEGQPLPMQPFAEGVPDTELTITFPRAQTENGFTVPDQNTVFRLVSFEHLPGDARSGPAFLVQVFQAGQNEPTFNEFITTDTTIELAGARFELDLTGSMVLTAAYDPGFSLVLAGSAIAWLGCLMGLVKPYRGWRAIFTPARDGTRLVWRAVDLGIRPDGPLTPSALRAPRGSSSAALRWAAALAPVWTMAILTASLWWGQWTSGRYWMELNSQKWLLTLALAALSWQAWRWPKVTTGK